MKLSSVSERPQRDLNWNSGNVGVQESTFSAVVDTPSDAGMQVGPPLAHPVGRAERDSRPVLDAVERALADALQRAALAGAFDVVTVLTAELRARRETRAQVVNLDTERAKRGR